MERKYGRLAAGILAASATLALIAGRSERLASAQNPPTNRLIDNARVTVMRVIAAPGSRQDMHLSPQDLVAIQAGPGQIVVRIGSETLPGGQGKAFYLPKTTEHAVDNPGQEPVEMIVVSLK